MKRVLCLILTTAILLGLCACGSKTRPILITVGLFEAFGYWNSWYYAMLYISANRSFSRCNMCCTTSRKMWSSCPPTKIFPVRSS